LIAKHLKRVLYFKNNGGIHMPGAKLIINSRYFHIARTGEKADGKHSMTRDAAMGLVNYVGTREGCGIKYF
jgi:hypothetical protein